MTYRLDLKIGDKYKMIKKVGSGAFGEIFKGMYFILIKYYRVELKNW